MLFTQMTRKAMSLAYEAHHGQTDKAGVPYIFHPARVASGFTDEAAACTAWLHDVIEDTDYTIDDIRLAGFGSAICDALQLLTHNSRVTYMDYVKALAKNPIARAVKLADLRDNMDITRIDKLDDKAKQRLEKYQEAYAYLSPGESRAQ